MANHVKQCFCCSKGLMYLMNLLFWMLGAALLGLGIWLHITNDAFLALTPSYSFLTPAALFIAPGCLAIIVGFIGCCGAVTENRCLVTTYCVLAVVVFGLELAGGVATFIDDIRIKNHVKDQLYVSMHERYPIENDNSSQANHYIVGWDKLQQQFKCCGVDSYTDWFKSHGWPKQDKVPDSCCITQYVNCGLSSDYKDWFPQGCAVPLEDFIDNHLFTVAVTTIVFAGLQLIAMVGAILFLIYGNKKKQLS